MIAKKNIIALIQERKRMLDAVEGIVSPVRYRAIEEKVVCENTAMLKKSALQEALVSAAEECVDTHAQPGHALNAIYFSELRTPVPSAKPIITPRTYASRVS